MNQQQEEVVTLRFINYTSIPFKAEIYADNLIIDWGDGEISNYKNTKNCLNLLHYYESEGTQQIKITGNNIFQLNLSGQNICELSFQNCRNLEYLNCSGNELFTLDIRECEILEELHCNSNNLTELIIPELNKLNQINISYNKLSKLQLANCSTLQTLYCAYNKLTGLDFSDNSLLNDINISHNFLTPECINHLFQQLSPQSEQDYAIIHYPGNPGFENCDVHILSVKNWH